MKKLVLVSGGLDSTVCLAIALHTSQRHDVAALCVQYGQKHDKELAAARHVCAHYQIPLHTIDLTACFKDSTCSLLKSSPSPLAQGSYEDQLAHQSNGRVQSYVPFRNGLMLSAAAAVCESLFPAQKCQILIGSHLDDATTSGGRVAYPDCSPAFDDAMDRAISLGTYGDVHIDAPLKNMTKADVVSCGASLGVPFELTWSCYNGSDKPCGKCATCIDRQKAFAQNHLQDPACMQ